MLGSRTRRDVVGMIAASIGVSPETPARGTTNTKGPMWLTSPRQADGLLHPP